MSSAQLLAVSVAISLADGAVLPSEGVVTAKLVDGEGEVLAATATTTSSVPVELTLTADPALTSAPSTLLVWAALRTDDGFWGTTELAPVDGDATSVLLTKIED